MSKDTKECMELHPVRKIKEFAIVLTFRQAARFAPDDMPTSRPSSLANLLAFAIASSAVTVMISSVIEVSKFLGTNPGPTP